MLGCIIHCYGKKRYRQFCRYIVEWITRSEKTANNINTGKPKSMKLGCCYYPEHWPEEDWDENAVHMREMGLSLVRIGEFSWSRIEPATGNYDWEWLDRAIASLAKAGLKIILGTPTATPPKWLVDSMPDMIAIDSDGKPRKFGSRRHYCFSHLPYRAECIRITKALAERYGSHTAITAWQTDNEYGCHNTVLSYSKAAAQAFRLWLADKYDDIDALNKTWGNVFWSMEYQDFDAIDPPNLTVTEVNPAHVLDYRRFASDEVVSFNALQTEIIRGLSPDRDIIHNFMGFYTDFDHHKLGQDLDIASWDSYPLGFLEMYPFSEEDRNTYAQQGHPDIAAFHHDLYRGCSKKRWAVMEQQPGPVNWAHYNPAPLDGMVRLWSLEAMAHDAEFCSYFRWRQVPFAQEQMHAGLLRPDGAEAQGAREVRQTYSDIKVIMETQSQNHEPSIAIIFSYEAQWLFETQPQGKDFSYIKLVFEHYTALRSLGLNVDIVSKNSDLNDYAMIIIPSMPIIDKNFLQRIEALDIPILFGPRSGSKTENFSIPDNLAPGPLQKLINIKVSHVQSLRDGSHHFGTMRNGDDFRIDHWIESIEGDAEIIEQCDNGNAILCRNNNIYYLTAWPYPLLLKNILKDLLSDTRCKTIELPDGIRLRRQNGLVYIFNYGHKKINIPRITDTWEDNEYIIGEDIIESAGVSIFREILEK